MKAKVNKTYLSTEEATEYLGISKSLLYRLTSHSLIKHIKISRKLLRFKLNDLDEFMEKYKVYPIKD